jgi:hypothetical protein
MPRDLWETARLNDHAKKAKQLFASGQVEQNPRIQEELPPVNRTGVCLPSSRKTTLPVSPPPRANTPIVPSWVEKRIVDLDSCDARVRDDAKEALNCMKPEDLPGIFGLIKARQHKSFHVRAAVEGILARLAPLAVSTLVKLLLHVEKDVKSLLNNAGQAAKDQLAKAMNARRRNAAKIRRSVTKGKEQGRPEEHASKVMKKKQGNKPKLAKRRRARR